VISWFLSKLCFFKLNLYRYSAAAQEAATAAADASLERIGEDDSDSSQQQHSKLDEVGLYKFANPADP
jgi:hypothetical protein